MRTVFLLTLFFLSFNDAWAWRCCLPAGGDAPGVYLTQSGCRKDGYSVVEGLNCPSANSGGSGSNSSGGVKRCQCSIRFTSHNQNGPSVKHSIDLNGKDFSMQFNIPLVKSCKSFCYVEFGANGTQSQDVLNAKASHASYLRKNFGICAGWISGDLLYDGGLYGGTAGGSGLWSLGIGGGVKTTDNGYEVKTYCAGTPEEYVYSKTYYVNKCQLILKGQREKILYEKQIEAQGKDYCKSIIPLTNENLAKYDDQMALGVNEIQLYYFSNKDGASAVVQSATYERKKTIGSQVGAKVPGTTSIK